MYYVTFWKRLIITESRERAFVESGLDIGARELFHRTLEKSVAVVPSEIHGTGYNMYRTQVIIMKRYLLTIWSVNLLK